MCYSTFTPNSGTASLSSWPHHQIQLTDFRVPGKQPSCPLNYKKREQCNVAVISVQRGKGKTYSRIFTYLLQLQPEDLGFRGCVSNMPLLLGCVLPCYPLQCREKNARVMISFSLSFCSLLSLTTGTFLEEGVGKSWDCLWWGRKLCSCLSLLCAAHGALGELYEFLAWSCCPGAPPSFRYTGTCNSANLSRVNTSLS